MTNLSDGFPLMVHVSADEWAYAKRRTAYLEAVLVQVLQDRERVQEWYDAAELIRIGLPGLPATKAGITRTARASGWKKREVNGRGGIRYQYHYTSFPSRAFDALISRILDVPEPSPEADFPPVPEIEPALAEAPKPNPANAAPAWVLPFMRLLKGGAKGDLGAAWAALPDHVPRGVRIPSKEEAATVIMRWGLA